jgi:Putative FMN-binding domain
VYVPRYHRQDDPIIIDSFIHENSFATLVSGTESGLVAVHIPIELIAHHHVPAERLTFIGAFGVLVGIGGVGLIFSSQLMAKGSMARWGCLAVLLASFTIAYSHVPVKSRGAHLDRGLLTAVQMCFACVPLLIAGLVVDGNPLRFRWTVLTVV